MILGIPNRNRFAKLPSIGLGEVETNNRQVQSQIWRINVQEHKADRAGLHYDLRLNPSNTSDAFSWAIRTTSLPMPGQKVLAVEQPTHSSSYMGWSGKIDEGYGAGEVRSIIDEDVEVLKSEPDNIEFVRLSGTTQPQRFMLKRTNGKDWLLYNYTATTNNALIPDYKPHYKDVNIEDIDIDDNMSVLSPKIDGAHNTIILRPDKRIDLYSYRKSLRSNERIDHSFKTNLYKIRSPKELGTTVLRGELYIKGQPAHAIAGVLNSNTPKSREKQKTLGPLRTMIFDVVKYKGRSAENLPYAEKLKILSEVNSYLPDLELPPLAITPEEKRKLIDDVKSKTHALTEEGVIAYPLLQSTPIKAKIKKDYDVLITGVFPATPGSKYSGNAIGGFIGIPETNVGGDATNIGSRLPIQIGSGLSDELRRAAYKNPDAFIGRWATVSGQLQYEESGKLRMPIFKGFRLDKY